MKENPWLRVPAEEYEAHMNLPAVGQLACLNTIFAEVYARYAPASLVVPGCATGNGFEHIDPALTQQVVGIDINGAYLDILRARFPGLAPALRLIQGPVESCSLAESSFDLVHAGLIFEYVEPGPAVEKFSEWLAGGGVLSVVLQLPAPSGRSVSDSDIESVKLLEPVIELVPPQRLESLAAAHGLEKLESGTVTLPKGKAFYTGLFRKQQSTSGGKECL